MENKLSLQESFLNKARKEKMQLTVFLTNGFQQRGVVTAFDGYTLLLYHEGKQHLIYKHAISTMIPARNLELNQEEPKAE